MPYTSVAKISIGWLVVVATGIGAFYFSKKSIDQSRYESMKVRERLRNINSGDYEFGERYSFMKKD